LAIVYDFDRYGDIRLDDCGDQQADRRKRIATAEGRIDLVAPTSGQASTRDFR